LKKLDSGFRRNDKKWCFSTFYEFIKIAFISQKYKQYPRSFIVISNDYFGPTKSAKFKLKFKSAHEIQYIFKFLQDEKFSIRQRRTSSLDRDLFIRNGIGYVIETIKLGERWGKQVLSGTKDI